MRLHWSNLIAVARLARAHVFGVETPPLDVQDLRGRLAALLASGRPRFDAVLLGFGPREGPAASPFAALWSCGLLDCAKHGAAGCFTPADVLHPVESQLAAALDRWPDGGGFVLVVALLERSVSGDELWRHAAEVDEAARECLRRAERGTTRAR